MSVVKINVLQVPEGRGEVLESRFASRAGEVDKVDGFESFQLLRPTQGTDRYLVVTTWRDDAAFEAWMNSAAFSQGHARSQADADAQTASDSGGHPGGAGASGGHPGDADASAGHSGGAGGGGAPQGGPAAVGSELWGFEIVTSSVKA